MRIKHLCVLIHMFKHSSNFLTDCSKAVLLLWIFFLICVRVCLCHTVLYVPSSLVVTCWEGAELLALVFVMFSYVFVTFLSGALVQVWYLIV